MSDPTHSSSWTGSTAVSEPTYGDGMSSVSSDYERLLRVERELEKTPPELRRLQRLGVFLILSPAALWIAYWFSSLAIPAAFGQDYSAVLASWTVLVITVGCAQLTSKSRHFIRAKRAAIAATIAATVAGAILYGYEALSSYSEAMALPRERTFEIYRCHGRCRYGGGYYVHQRANGTTVEGESAGRPLPYATTCTTVQRFVGDFGFSWVKVLERSPPPQREIIWPIRREDCFSDKPINLLRS